MKQGKLLRRVCFLAVHLFAIASLSESAEIAEPHWIWSSADRELADPVVFSRNFSLSQSPRQATLRGLAAFSDATIYLNGQLAGRFEAFDQRMDFDVTRLCKPGENVLKLEVVKLAGPSAFAVELEATATDGTRQSVVSDATWTATPRNKEPTIAHSFGPLGLQSWAGRADELKIEASDEYNQWKEAQNSTGVENASKFFVRPGFQLEVVGAAKADEGSWISLAFDPKGRVIISREKRGLLRLAIAADGQAGPLEVIDDTLLECRGLLFAFDSLYAHANNSKALYRLRDVDGDDKFEEATLLARTEGDVGHGRNDLILGPDQKIYVVCGDDVLPPEHKTFLTPPERLPEHRKEGFIARTDASGARWEVLTTGLRNPYGLAFNADDELFTFDADMELDLGFPYYRPTGVFQIASGCDYGWRRTPNPTPQYIPDTLSHTLTIGKSSPTSIVFGTESNFPPTYQRALFLLDWSYGRIIAVHMLPRGAGYICRGETFLRGRPLNVTDLTFGPDGAMYFTTGGRGTQSALYRVRAVNAQQAKLAESLQEHAMRTQATTARTLKRKLESYHGQQDPAAVSNAWPHLADRDPLIAHAARVAIEHQPIAEWKGRAMTESNVDIRLIAQLALARVGPNESLDEIVSQLSVLDLASLSVRNQLAVLRIYEVCSSRQPLPSSLVEVGRHQIERICPHDSVAVNQELAKLLVTFDSPKAVEKLLALTSSAATPEESLHYLFVLRDAKCGWTDRLRRDYFSRLHDLEAFEKHYAHMVGFLGRIKSDASAKLSESERTALADVLAPVTTEEPAETISSPPRPLVKNWKLADFADALSSVAQSGKPEAGREVFAAASCSRCHRFRQTGRGLGPDLTHVANRFSPADILGAILEPSQAVDEKYRSIAVTTTDGEVLTGQFVVDDYRESLLRIAPNPLNPSQSVAIPKSKIESFARSSTSIMPTGLLDTFSREEIASLLAYLTAPANQE